MEPIAARLPSTKSNSVKYACSFDRQQNKAFLALLTAFAEKHPEKVTSPFTTSGFTLELEAGHWVHKPRHPRKHSSVSKFYRFELVGQFVGIKQAGPAAHAGEANRPL